MDEELLFLDTRPPHWAINGLAYVIIVGVTLALLALVTIQVPESVTSSFILVPTQGTDPVRAVRSGVVAQVHAMEGQAARQGEPLFVIRSPLIGERASELSSVETQLGGVQESLANAAREHENQRRADSEEARRLEERITSLTRIINHKKEQLALARELAARYEEGLREELTSKVEVLRLQMDVEALAAKLQESEKERKEASVSLDRVRYEAEARVVKQRELERSLKEVMEKSRIRIAALRKELVHSQGNELSVMAPCSGTVLRLHVKAADAYVNEGELLGELACRGERLHAELTVPQSGAARVRTGQGVKLLYDTFPYQRYGVRFGTVRWISPATVSANGTAFHGFADLDDDAIVVDGQPRPLRAGMRGTAKVVVGRRLLITYAFEPLRQLRESFVEPPNKPDGEKAL